MTRFPISGTALLGSKFAYVACAATAVFIAQPAFAAGTLAGTSIENTATASYDGPDGPVDVPSNTVSLLVDELLDVSVAGADPGDVAVQPGDDTQVLGYTVTNTGNGSEAFTLIADVARAGDEFDPTLVSIVIDTNGNGVYDPGEDEVYVAGSNDPILAADGSLTVFIIVNIPADATDGQRAEVNLRALANTGTGDPGTSFAGQGEGGGDAVIGASGGDGDDSGYFAIEAALVAFVKSALVANQFGGDQAIPGATITYTLTATVTGSGTISNLAIADTVPSGTNYVVGSITLGGSGLTDSASDADGGSFDSGAIRVALGDVSGGQTRTVTFQVNVQ